MATLDNKIKAACFQTLYSSLSYLYTVHSFPYMINVETLVRANSLKTLELTARGGLSKRFMLYEY